MPKVSVVVPVYNAEKYIERCARSLFEQTLDDIEYIFVNDCTPDNSMQVLDSILQDYPNRVNHVRIINHTVNTGQSGSRRDGMLVASGDYVIHCDADDWVDVEMYEEMYNAAIETGADSVTCDMVMEFGESYQILKYNNSYDDHRLMYDCIAPISVEYCSMCNRLISMRVFDLYSVQPFEGVNMWDDVGLSIRIRYYTRENVVINEPLYHYNRQNENSTTRRPVLDRTREQLECARQLELFFKTQNVYDQYRHFVVLVKLVAKLDLLDYDGYLWKNVFPETRWFLYMLKGQIPLRRIIRMIVIAFGGKIGIRLLQMLSTIKNKFRDYQNNYK